MRKNSIPLDENGISFSRPVFQLDIREYKKIVSEINCAYDVKYKNKLLCSHASFGIDGVAYIYWFENHGFNDYNIYLRTFNIN